METDDMMGLLMAMPFVEVCDMLKYVCESKNSKKEIRDFVFTDVKFSVSCELLTDEGDDEE